MENLNEIIAVLKKLSLDGKGLYLDNIIELCNKDYNMERANVISKLNKGVDLNIIKKVENKYGKLSYRINKDAIKESKVSNTERYLRMMIHYPTLIRCMRKSNIKL